MKTPMSTQTPDSPERFSVRRALRFCRLQLTEMYGKPRFLIFSLTGALVIPGVALLINGGSPAETLDYTEKMLVIAAFLQTTVLYRDLLSNRLQVPATALEKYLSVYAGSLLVALVFLLIAIPVSSLACAAAFRIGGSGTGGTLLFFRADAPADHRAILGIITLMIVFLAPWIDSLRSAAKRFGKAVFWSVVLAFAAAAALSLVLGLAGILSGTAVKLLNAVILMVEFAAAAVWNYRLLLRYEADEEENE